MHSNELLNSSEADWNSKLHALDDAQEEYNTRNQDGSQPVSTSERKRLLELATDFPTVWSDPKTPHRERKRMLALLIEDVTLIKQNKITLDVRCRGGATMTLILARPLTAQQIRVTLENVRLEIDQLLAEYTDSQVANILNQRGLQTGAGDAFDQTSVQWVRFSLT